VEITSLNLNFGWSLLSHKMLRAVGVGLVGDDTPWLKWSINQGSISKGCEKYISLARPPTLFIILPVNKKVDQGRSGECRFWNCTMS
jgi:hypothetical protein